MARVQIAVLCCVLASLLASNVYASDSDAVLEMEFLEFLAEGKVLEGKFSDPLHMQDWEQKQVVDAGKQQEDKEHD